MVLPSEYISFIVRNAKTIYNGPEKVKKMIEKCSKRLQNQQEVIMAAGSWCVTYLGGN